MSPQQTCAPRPHADSSPAPGDGSGMHASSSRRLLLLSEAVTPPDAVRRAPSPSTAARRVHLTQNQLRLSAHPPDQGLSAAMVVVAAGRALPSMPEQLKPPAGTRLQIFERELQAKAKEVNGPYYTPLLSEIIYCRADLYLRQHPGAIPWHRKSRDRHQGGGWVAAAHGAGSAGVQAPTGGCV